MCCAICGWGPGRVSNERHGRFAAQRRDIVGIRSISEAIRSAALH